jgi:murein DD-endopeptidase MepM/ murein hydrolase activator NlpD
MSALPAAVSRADRAAPAFPLLLASRAVVVVAIALLSVLWSPPPAAAQTSLGSVGSAAPRAEGTVADLDEAVARALSRVEQEQARSTAAEQELATLGERHAAAARRLRTRTRALYRITRAGMLPLAGGFNALLGHLARVERLERMLRADVEEKRALARRGQVLRAEIARSAEAIARARAELRSLEEQRSALLASRQAEAVLAAVLERTAGDGAVGRSAASVDDLPFSGSFRVVDDEPARPMSFALRRGSLAMPLAGDVRISQDGAGGLVLESTTGSGVRAVEAGRVAFAGRHGEQGLLVVVDHGERYVSVYANLASTEVSVGDTVGRGTRLGTAGASMRFELRQGTRPLDARAWLGL